MHTSPVVLRVTGEGRGRIAVTLQCITALTRSGRRPDVIGQETNFTSEVLVI